MNARWYRGRGVLLLVPMVIMQGCYSHTAVRPEGVVPGSAVRARVSAGEAARLETVLGREARLLTGEVVEVRGDGLMVEVPGASGSGRRLAQRVTIPGSELLELELRELDRTRTFGVIAVAAALGGYIAYAQFQGSRTGTGGAPRPGGDQSLIGLGFGWTF